MARNNKFKRGEIFFAQAKGVKVTYSCLDPKMKELSRMWKVKISSDGMLYEAYELSEDQARSLAELAVADLEVGFDAKVIATKYGFEE